ncbi:MAG: DegT/DnrJ/EryC1/StrS aminotransferase family protein [Candidatus Marsarchaeota archaeon]|nr:DegT/DnrJ/EryC1/StrS aminotransferase family protein [Candidatus Marsarchaeota archaeon]
MIPVQRPCLGEEELGLVREVFSSRWLGLGSMVKRFEDELSNYLGAKYVIAVNTGTSALHIALASFGVKPGDEIVTPSLTFAACPQTILACGAKPVFCDVDGDTLNIDVEDMERRITDKTRAIMPVHYGGQPCRMDEILDVARRRNILVIEDAAHAFGTVGDATCFSFDPVKNITCGEGGAVATDNDEVAQEIYKKRILGIDKDTWSRYKDTRTWFYEVTTEGFRYHLSNINAAIGLVQLGRLQGFIDKKRSIAKRYDDAFKGIPGVQILSNDYESTAPFFYVMRVRDRAGLMSFLKERGIDTGVHYIPNHLQPLFGGSHTALPVTEQVWEEIITLPLYVEMASDDVESVIGGVRAYIGCGGPGCPG